MRFGTKFDTRKSVPKGAYPDRQGAPNQVVFTAATANATMAAGSANASKRFRDRLAVSPSAPRSDTTQNAIPACLPRIT